MHDPTDEEDEVAAKEEFYSSLEKVHDAVPTDNTKTTTKGLQCYRWERILFIYSMWREQPS
jgi:hypothetical protein